MGFAKAGAHERFTAWNQRESREALQAPYKSRSSGRSPVPEAQQHKCVMLMPVNNASSGHLAGPVRARIRDRHATLRYRVLLP